MWGIRQLTGTEMQKPSGKKRKKKKKKNKKRRRTTLSMNNLAVRAKGKESKKGGVKWGCDGTEQEKRLKAKRPTGLVPVKS